MRIDGTILGHGAVQAELVPEVGHDTSHGGREIGYYLTGELLDSLLHVFPDGRCTWTLHYRPPAIKASGSEYCTQISRRGARVKAERELSTFHSWDWADTTAGLLDTAWITGWFR